MKKRISLLLCCGVLVSMVGCGSNTAPPPTESSPITVAETAIIETTTDTTPPVIVAEPTEKEIEPVTTKSEDQGTESTVVNTEPTTTTQPTEETTTIATSTAEEKVTPPIEETVESTISQLTERETTATELPKEESKAETEPPKVSEPEPTEKAVSFDIEYWIAYAKSYAESKGLVLRNTALDCWDNPIRAGAHCICLERDIQSRLDRYARDEDITDVWIWAETTGNDCYVIYIGYA